MRRHTLSAIVAVMTTLALVPAVVAVEETQGTPQWTPHKPGSDNIEVLSHLPLGPRLNVSDIELEQEVSRPFAYVGRMVYGFAGEKGDGHHRSVRSSGSESDLSLAHRGSGSPSTARRNGCEVLQVGRSLLRRAVVAVRTRGSRRRSRGRRARRHRPAGRIEGQGSGANPRPRASRRVSQHLHVQAFQRSAVAVQHGFRAVRARLRHGTRRRRAHGRSPSSQGPGGYGSGLAVPWIPRHVRRVPRGYTE